MLGTNNGMSILIVDDEDDARENIITNLHPFLDSIQSIEEASDVGKAAICIKDQEPDLIFLDIEMPRKNGFELLKAFPELRSQVIFVTSYNNYAVEAFKHFALGYLLKPIDPDDFKKTFIKARQANRANANIRNFNLLLKHLGKKSSGKRIMINSDSGIEIISENEICYLEAKRNYTFVFLDKKKLVSSKNLAKFEEELSSDIFFRSHRSFLVNTHLIESIQADGIIVMKNGATLSASRAQKSKLLSFLSNMT